MPRGRGLAIAADDLDLQVLPAADGEAARTGPKREGVRLVTRRVGCQPLSVCGELARELCGIVFRLGDDETQRINTAAAHVAIGIACDALQGASLVENVVVRQGVYRHVVTGATIDRIVARATDQGVAA